MHHLLPPSRQRHGSLPKPPSNPSLSPPLWRGSFPRPSVSLPPFHPLSSTAHASRLLRPFPCLPPTTTVPPRISRARCRRRRDSSARPRRSRPSCSARRWDRHRRYRNRYRSRYRNRRRLGHRLGHQLRFDSRCRWLVRLLVRLLVRQPQAPNRHRLQRDCRCRRLLFSSRLCRLSSHQLLSSNHLLPSVNLHLPSNNLHLPSNNHPLPTTLHDDPFPSSVTWQPQRPLVNVTSPNRRLLPSNLLLSQLPPSDARQRLPHRPPARRRLRSRPIPNPLPPNNLMTLHDDRFLSLAIWQLQRLLVNTTSLKQRRSHLLNPLHHPLNPLHHPLNPLHKSPNHHDSPPTSSRRSLPQERSVSIMWSRSRPSGRWAVVRAPFASGERWEAADAAVSATEPKCSTGCERRNAATCMLAKMKVNHSLPPATRCWMKSAASTCQS